MKCWIRQYIMCLNSPAPTYPENTNLPISKSGTSCSHMLHYLQLYIVNPVGMGVCKFFIVLVFFSFFCLVIGIWKFSWLSHRSAASRWCAAFCSACVCTLHSSLQLQVHLFIYNHVFKLQPAPLYTIECV